MGTLLLYIVVFIATLSKYYYHVEGSIDVLTFSNKVTDELNLPFSTEKEKCVEYLNSNLNEFLQKLERPTNKDGTPSVGKKIKKLMNDCRGASFSVVQNDITDVRTNEKKLQVEHMVMQRIVLRPINRQSETNAPSDCSTKTDAVTQDLRIEKEKTKKLEQELDAERISFQVYLLKLNEKHNASLQQIQIQEAKKLKTIIDEKFNLQQLLENEKIQHQKTILSYTAQEQECNKTKEKDQQMTKETKKNHEESLKQIQILISNCQEAFNRTEEAVNSCKNEGRVDKEKMKEIQKQLEDEKIKINTFSDEKFNLQQLLENDKIQHQKTISLYYAQLQECKNARETDQKMTNEMKKKHEESLQQIQMQISNYQQNLIKTEEVLKNCEKEVNVLKSYKQQCYMALTGYATTIYQDAKIDCVSLNRTRTTLENCMAAFSREKTYPGVEVYTRYSYDRLGLLNAQPLKPEFSIEVNDVLAFRFPISIPSCSEVKGRRNIFIAIISAAENFENRAMIRQTWAKDLNTFDRRVTGFAGFAFILGRTQDASIQKRIEQENKANKDIIQIDMADVYRNGPIKIAGLLNWMQRFCANFKGFLLKVDDNVYVSVRTLEYFIHDNDPSSPSLFGAMRYIGSSYPVRESQSLYSITFNEWPWKEYPVHLAGSAYLLSSEAIVPLVSAIQTTPMMPFEDIYITGLCAEKANINMKTQDTDQTHVTASVDIDVSQLDGCTIRRLTTIVNRFSQMTQIHLKTTKFYRDNSPAYNCPVVYANGKKKDVNFYDDPLIPPL